MLGERSEALLARLHQGVSDSERAIALKITGDHCSQPTGWARSPAQGGCGVASGIELKHEIFS